VSRIHDTAHGSSAFSRRRTLRTRLKSALHGDTPPLPAADELHAPPGTGNDRRVSTRRRRSWIRNENVIYIYSHNMTSLPPYQYFAMPSACLGGAASLEDAHRAYQSDLATLQRAETAAARGVLEHLEPPCEG
jgi:hypothetical protein